MLVEVVVEFKKKKTIAKQQQQQNYEFCCIPRGKKNLSTTKNLSLSIQKKLLFSFYPLLLI